VVRLASTTPCMAGRPTSQSDPLPQETLRLPLRRESKRRRRHLRSYRVGRRPSARAIRQIALASGRAFSKPCTGNNARNRPETWVSGRGFRWIITRRAASCRTRGGCSARVGAPGGLWLVPCASAGEVTRRRSFPSGQQESHPHRPKCCERALSTGIAMAGVPKRARISRRERDAPLPLRRTGRSPAVRARASSARSRASSTACPHSQE